MTVGSTRTGATKAQITAYNKLFLYKARESTLLQKVFRWVNFFLAETVDLLIFLLLVMCVCLYVSRKSEKLMNYTSLIVSMWLKNVQFLLILRCPKPFHELEVKAKKHWYVCVDLDE